MLLVNFVRIAKNSWRNFYRNLWLSLATLGMMTLALMVIGGLVLFNAALEGFVDGLREKADVSVYFEETADEEAILAVQETLEQREDVREVTYVSREQAAEIFRERNQDKPLYIAALEELDENPLQASLDIKVQRLEDFGLVLATLENSEAADMIAEIDYSEREAVINRINDITANVSMAGGIFIIALAIFVFAVTYNTVRLAIYTARDEIHIMKLVGASNWYVRGPFILTGTIYGIVAAAATFILLLLGTWRLQSFEIIVNDINLFEYLMGNIAIIVAVLLGSGIVLGMASSYLAVRRYLNV